MHRDRHGPTVNQFADAAWKIQTHVNQWFQENGQPWTAMDLTPLAHR